MHLCRLFRSRRDTCSYCPDRFVCDRDLFGRKSEVIIKSRIDLLFKDIEHNAAFPFRKRLADTENEMKPVFLDEFHLFADEVVRFAKNPATLAMADDDSLNAEIFKHLSADHAGKSAFSLRIDILSRDRYIFPCGKFCRHFDVGISRRDHDFSFGIESRIAEFSKEINDFFGKIVHLPVCRDYCSPHKDLHKKERRKRSFLSCCRQTRTKLCLYLILNQYF